MIISISMLIFSILFSILSWKRPVFALSLLVLLLPTYLIRFDLYGLPMTALEVMILVLFAAWFFQKIYRHELSTITFSKYKYLIGLWLIAGLIAVFVGGGTNATLGIYKAYFIEPILFFIVFINTIRERKDLFLVLNALGASALVISIISIVQHFTGWNVPPEFWKDGRVTAVYGFPNAVGLYLAPIVVIVFAKGTGGLVDCLPCSRPMVVLQGLTGTTMRILKIVHRSTSSQPTSPPSRHTRPSPLVPRSPGLYFNLIVIVSALAAMIFAKSEGAIIGTVVSCGLLFFVHLRIKLLAQGFKNKKIILFSLFSLITLFSLLAIVPATRNYLEEKLTLSDRSGQIRQQMWKETWQMLTDKREIFGAGLANYQNSIAPYHASGIYIRNDDPDFDKMIKISLEYQQKTWQPIEIYLYPHNIFLNLWSEVGLFGLIVLFLIILKVFWSYRKVKNPENLPLYFAVIAAFIAILIHGLVDVPYFKNDLSVLFWLIVGLGVVISRSKKTIIK